MGLRILLTLLLAVPAFAAEWDVVIEQVSRSVVEVQTTESHCTGFVINSSRKNENKEDVDLILTAAHCDGEELYADHSPAKVISKDSKHDLLVLEIEDTERPALKLAKSNPKPGVQVMSYGYGYALERPMARIANVSDDKTYIPSGGIGGPLVVIDAAFVPGQSGGPVVNANGEVVMIVQMGTSILGLGRGAEDIKKRVGRYFEKVPAPEEK